MAYLAVLGQLLGHVPKLILENLKDKAIYFRYLAIALIAAGGIFLFLIIPALIFMAIEGWTYRESIYYAFITLSTIGFGDFVAAQQADRPPDLSLRQFYGVCVSLWIYIGLAFLAILLTDVGGAMTSLWKRLKLRIKRGHTRFKIKKEMEELGIQPKQIDEEAGSPEKKKPPLETPQEQDTSKGPSQASNQESQQTREDETEDTSSKEEVKENLSAVEDQTTVEGVSSSSLLCAVCSTFACHESSQVHVMGHLRCMSWDISGACHGTSQVLVWWSNFGNLLPHNLQMCLEYFALQC